ncbi:MAG: TIGR04222 domain-containing membrane protein [Syntrophobacteraceae bacterium]|nr:TIGR04222 domain-containing membrane protein [Desulfobacteraceae bacterium]
MDFLTDDPLADMYGPDFLILYAAAIIIALIVARRMVRNAAPADLAMPLTLPLRPDPVEVAYLRGGEAEVIRFTVFKLIQNRLVMLNDAKSGTIVRIEDNARASALGGFERAVYDSLYTPRKMKDVVKALFADFQARCLSYRTSLEDRGLLATAFARAKALRVRLYILALIFGLGGYKLAVALSRGHTNVLFLVIMAIIGTILAFKVCRVPRLSRRGREYLDRFKAQVRPTAEAASKDQMSGFDDGALAFQVALLGFAVLAGTSYAAYADTLSPPASSFGDVTGGCGGGGCGGGSDSGGSSSDGGGGCGGGGCGGCGGGD